MTTSLTEASFTAALRAALRPGMTVALGDGVGSLRCLDDGGSVGASPTFVAMERIFVSSLARGGMGAIRQGARDGVESLGMLPVMFETQPASDQNSRQALLDQIRNCDAYLLLLGALFLHEPITAPALIGMALIGLGLAAIDGRLVPDFRRRSQVEL